MLTVMVSVAWLFFNVSADRKPGSVEVEFEAPNASAVMGSVAVTNEDQGIAWDFFLYGRRTDEEATVRPVRGMFWFPNNQADCIVAVQNMSDENILITPVVNANGQSTTLASKPLLGGQGFTLELRKALKDAGMDALTAGGIEFRYEGPVDAVRAHGVIFDRKGYSAEVDFIPFGTGELRTIGLRTPRFATGAADPKLGLGQNATFAPVLWLHNFAAYPTNLTLSVGRVNGAPQTMSTPITLPPLGSRNVDLAALVPGVSPWASLELSYRDTSPNVVTALVSTTLDGKRSLRSVMNWVEGNNREGWHWRADADHSTYLSIFNAGGDAAKAEITLDYTANGQTLSYRLPDRTFGAKESALIDIGELLANQVPDVDGKIIPNTVTTGGYHVRKVGPHLEQTLVTEALVFDRQRKNFRTIYNTCCGIQGVPTFSPSQFLGPVGPLGNMTVYGTDYCSQQVIDITPSSFFNSSNTAISTISSPGGGVTGVAPGSTFSNGSINYQKQKTVDGCINASANASKPTTVKPVISGPNEVWYFGGEMPLNYPVEITLQSSGGAGTIWAVVQGSTKVTTTPQGSTMKVRSSGSSYSGSTGDILITAQVNGVTSDQFHLTTRTPKKFTDLVYGPNCDSGFGYDDYFNYFVRDQLDQYLTQPVEFGERWTTSVVSDASNNWTWPTEGGAMSGTLQGKANPIDEVTGVGTANTPPSFPSPNCAQTGTQVQHRGQQWTVGNTLPGRGVAVQNDSMTRFTNHAEHQSIVSPLP